MNSSTSQDRPLFENVYIAGAWLELIAFSWCLPLEVFLRRNHGERYLSARWIVYATGLTFLIGWWWSSAANIPLSTTYLAFIAAFVFRALWIRGRTALIDPRHREHTYYPGEPWRLWTKYLRLPYSVTLIIIEPAVVLTCASFIAPFDPLLARYVAVSAIALCAKQFRRWRAWVEFRRDFHDATVVADDIGDGVLEADAPEFFNVTGAKDHHHE